MLRQTRKNMDDLRKQQMEALEAVYDYNKKIIPALQTVIEELRGAEKEDTKDYLDYVLKGINWVIQVTNGTMKLINEEEVKIDKEETNQIILDLNDAIRSKNNLDIAMILERGIVPFINKLSECAKEYVTVIEN